MVETRKHPDTDGVCAFCANPAKLQDSHVLPAFVYRWLRERSGTGHIRQTDNPNRRIQDGLKLPWLCIDCEREFSRYETAFATKLFHPWHAGEHRIAYDNWLLKFCVSISWRVLSYAENIRNFSPATEEQRRLVRQAEERWRAFLKNEAPHPSLFEQHLLIFDGIESTTIADLPTNINRFMAGAVTFDIVGSNRSLMTFAKLGRFMIFGIIQKGADCWEGTKVHVKHGVVKPGRFVIPAGLLDLFHQKANETHKALGKMSTAQYAKIDRYIAENLDEFSESDQFQAIAADAMMFGPGAVTRKK